MSFECRFLIIVNLFFIALLSGVQAVKTESILMILVFLLTAIAGASAMVWHGFTRHKMPCDSQHGETQLNKKQTAAAVMVALALAAVIVITYTYVLFWTGLLPI